MSRLVYVAGPIDQAGPYEAELAQLRTKVKDELSAAGFGTYDPSLPYQGGGFRDAHAIHQINTAALREAAGMVALLPAGVATIGTPMEVQQAHDLGIPVVVIGGAGSVQLMGMGVPATENVGLAITELRELIEAARWGGQRPDEIRYTSVALGTELTPTRGHPGDAGFDLYVSKTVEIKIGQFVDVPCGISVQFPPGVWGMITGRSSTLRQRGLLVAQGIIDNGYHGPLYAGVQNLAEEVRYVREGERIAQLIPFPVLADGLDFVRVEKLGESSRGTAGFGSTGA